MAAVSFLGVEFAPEYSFVAGKVCGVADVLGDRIVGFYVHKRFAILG